MADLPWFLIVLHVTGAAGVTTIVSLGLVTAPIRDQWAQTFKRFPVWAKMLACPQCFGVYAGAAWFLPLVFRGHLGPFRYVHDGLSFAFTVSLIGFVTALAEAAVGRMGGKQHG